MRSASALTSTIEPCWSPTINASGAASTSSRNGRFQSRSIVDPDTEHRARAVVLDPDPPTVGFDGELAERQPEPAVRASALGGGEEPLEHLRASFLRDARAAIDDAQLEALAAVLDDHLDGRSLGRVP